MKKILAFAILALIFTSSNLSAQELKIVTKEISLNVDQLPTYVIISSKKSEFLGDIAILIDSKNSYYEEQLEELEDMLQHRKKLKIRNQSDLLNAMDQLGFDYINSYNDKEKESSTALDETTRTYRINMVFKKMEKYSN